MDMTQKLNFAKGSYRLICKDFTELHTCPVCSFVFRDIQDIQSFHKFGACTECIDTYYYQNSDLWDKGWRPKIGDSNEYR